MANTRALLALVGLFSGQFYAVSAAGPNLCKTFGSGVFQTFNGTLFHVKSTCAFTLTRFTSSGVDCSISVQRGPAGLMNRVVIMVNKVTTILQDGVVSVEGNSITLPYDHTYQHVYRYGIYIKLKSKILPFSVTWSNSSGGISSLWVQLDQSLVNGMTGMCGRINSTENLWELVSAYGVPDGTCVTEDIKRQSKTQDCEFFSFARECLKTNYNIYQQLCLQNMYPNVHVEAKCAFIKELAYLCGNKSQLWSWWKQTSSCKQPSCAGDLKYQELGSAFPPTCSNPQANSDSLISTCLPPAGMVLNDRVDGFHAVSVKDCPCVHGERTFAPGQSISSKCLSCTCKNGKWACTPNTCPPRCIVEGQHVTTFDGKQYFLPGKCTYVAARGLSWTVTIKFSQTDMSIEEMNLDVYNERYTFAKDSVKLGDIGITDLSQTEHAIVSWQSSMFVLVQTSFGMKMQVQVSPEIQFYLYLPPTERTKGLCGTYNNNTEDDFTTSSSIVENSARPFALSWAVGDCKSDDLPICINSNNALFAEEKCGQLTNTSGVFASCHDYVPVNSFVEACSQRTCQCTSGLEECLCVALGNYAKACASQGIDVGDWRKASSCSLSCKGNLRFSYTMQACNRTCRSISGPDPTCEAPGDPVEGCGCLPGTHLNALGECSPRALCPCSYPGGTVPPGHHVIDGRKCMCENGNLQCSEACDCPQGKVCVYCAQESVKTAQKTCKSLSQPLSSEENCTSGCYCPEGQYEDHWGNCVTGDKCTCEFSGAVYSSGQSVESNCKSCVCNGGKWYCQGEPCPGVCEVFGNGEYNTFDSKWYHFDGHCQYTLVEDASQNGLFAVRVESVPCCDEALTCSRSVSVELQKEVTLTLRDMNVTQKMQAGWHLQTQSLYSVHTVGLYIIISVPELGFTLFWDRHTRVKVQLHARWKGQVRGLCGNFDGKVTNDLLTSSSSLVFSTQEFGNSWKAAVPPCSDVTLPVFPCQRHSYCSAWAQRRCMILYSDTFKDCHLKEDPHPYYEACVLESCSCEFEGKFLGFCTAVAAYAEACTTQNICINWRTPDLCPVYCDYYNEEGQYSWHYEPCGQIKTCGKNNPFTGKLEGCYPRCPPERPFYDENTRKCSSLDKCTCYFNSTIIGHGDTVTTPTGCCKCTEANIVCSPCPPEITTRFSKPATVPIAAPQYHPDTPTIPVITTTTSTPSTPEKTTVEYTSTMKYTTTPVTTTTTPSTSEITTEYITTPEIDIDIPTTTTITTTPEIPTTTPSTSEITTEYITTPEIDIDIPTTTTITTTLEIPTTTPSTSEITTEYITTTDIDIPTTTTITTTLEIPTTTPSTSEITTEYITTPEIDIDIPTTTTTPEIPTTTPSTSEITTEYITTPEIDIDIPTTTTITTTPEISTTTPSTSEITTEYITTPEIDIDIPAFCMDRLRNQTWPSGTEWTEDCFRKTCRNGVIEMIPVTCPLQDTPQCPRDLMRQVKDEQGCCDIWQCDCQCDIYGDPHYVSFSGTDFDFVDNCTYVLVKEINPRHHLSITVDNYFCDSLVSGSCAKGIVLKYLNNIVTLQVTPSPNGDEPTVEATLNDIVVQPPFEQNGIRFESGDYQVSVFIDKIRSRVSLSPYNTLEVILAMEFFYKNTQGQCGVCGGDSCVRRSGKVESDDCCGKTAYDWIEEDPAKPYCADAPRNVPCGSIIPPTPPSCEAPLCDLLRHELFLECGENIDMEALVQNCRFDYCLARTESSICSPLERLTEHCKKMGVCVSWRNLTNDGICDVTCPEGMYFDECRRSTNDVCQGGVRVAGTDLDNFQSGCFCPDNQILAERHKKLCVSECTYCKGPLGEPMPVGATWESNCFICTCNNQTLTEECWPKPPTPTPTCSANSTLVSDCCNNQICVEKTCEYNGKAYKVGDVWTDLLQPCVTLRCTSEGTEIEKRVCPQQSCPEDLRVWDEHHCCYSCNTACSVRESRMSVTVENCKQEVTLPICEGFCQSNSMWVRSGEVLQLEQNTRCCRESSYETRQLSLSCNGATTSYTYKHITGCECQSDR